MKKYFVILFCLMSFSTVNAQNNPLINPQISEINFVKHDSIRLFAKKISGFFKYKIIPAQDLFSSKQLFFNAGGPYFSHDTIIKPIWIYNYYGNLKPIIRTDTEAFSLFKKARIFRYTSDAFLLGEAFFSAITISRWANNNTYTSFEENRKSRMYMQAGLGCLFLRVGTQLISRHYLNKSIKKYNQNTFPY